MTMILISIELPITWNPRIKGKKNKKTMKIFELLWKRCFLYTANNGINDFLTKKKRRLEWKKKTILSWCLMFKIQGLIFCVEFRELSHLTCDLSQAEKKKKLFLLQADQLTKWQLFSLKMTILTILSEIDGCHFVHLLSL